MGIPWEYHGIPPNHPLKSQLSGCPHFWKPRGEDPQNLWPFSMRPSSILMENDLVIHESLDRGVQEQFLPFFLFFEGLSWSIYTLNLQTRNKTVGRTQKDEVSNQNPRFWFRPYSNCGLHPHMLHLQQNQQSLRTTKALHRTKGTWQRMILSYSPEDPCFLNT